MAFTICNSMGIKNSYEDEIFLKLTSFHLSAYEIRAYACLSMEGPLKMSDVIRKTGIPQPRIYDIFSSLERRGLISPINGIQKMYTAVAPSDAFSAQLSSMEEYVNELDEYVNANKHNGEKPSPSVSFIQSEKNNDENFRKFIREAKYEIILSMKSDRIILFLKELKLASERGVTVCVVIEKDGDKRVLEALEDICVIKHRELEPAEIIFQDGLVAAINMRSISKNSNYSMFIEEDELVDIISYYFYHMIWSPSLYIRDFHNNHKAFFSTVWLVNAAIENLLQYGSKLKASVTGMNQKNEVISIEGDVVSFERIIGLKESFSVESSSRVYSIGGRNGKLEDIKMEHATIY